MEETKPYQDFLKVVTNDFETVLKLCEERVTDFKTNIFAPCKSTTSSVEDLKSFFKFFRSLFIDVESNFHSISTEFFAKVVEFEKKFNISLNLDDDNSSVKNNEEKQEVLPNSTDFPKKTLSLSLTNRIDVESSGEFSNTDNEKEQQKVYNFLDESTILKELEESAKAKGRNLNDSGSTISVDTVIYSVDKFFSAQETFEKPNSTEEKPENNNSIASNDQAEFKSQSDCLDDTSKKSSLLELSEKDPEIVKESDKVTENNEITLDSENNRNDLSAETPKQSFVFELSEKDPEIAEESDKVTENNETTLDSENNCIDLNGDLSQQSFVFELTEKDFYPDIVKESDKVTENNGITLHSENNCNDVIVNNVESTDQAMEENSELLQQSSQTADSSEKSIINETELNDRTKENKNGSSLSSENITSPMPTLKISDTVEVKEESPYEIEYTYCSPREAEEIREVNEILKSVKEDDFNATIYRNEYGDIFDVSTDEFENQNVSSSFSENEQLETVLRDLQNDSTDISREVHKDDNSSPLVKDGIFDSEDLPDFSSRRKPSVKIKESTAVENLSDDFKDIIEKYGDDKLKQCRVVLERLQDIFKQNKSSDDDDDDGKEIRSLLNLKSLERKRKRKSSNESIENEKATAKIKKIVKNTGTKSYQLSDSSDTDDIFSEDTDEAFPNLLNLEKNQSCNSEDDLENEILLKQLSCNEMFSPTSSEKEESDDEVNEKKMTKKKSVQKKTQNGKKETPSWKKDPLLRKSLKSTSDSSDSESEEKLRKTSNQEQNDKSSEEIIAPKWKRNKYIFSSDSSDDDVKVTKNEPQDEWLIKDSAKSLNALNTIVLSSSSDDDIKILAESSKKNRKVNNNNRKKKEESNTNGRKNIRQIISDDTLRESTRKAIEEEKIRVERLSQTQSLLSDIYCNSSKKKNVGNGLILDIDKDTKSPLIVVHDKLTARLKKHQSEGIKFMWSACYGSVEEIKKGNKGSGCILAHCMGLGKTYQVVTLIHTLLNHEVTNTKFILIVCPLSTVLNWDNEFKIAFDLVPDSSKINLYPIGDQNRSVKNKMSEIKKWLATGGVLIMGYESYISAVMNKKNSPSTSDKVNKALVDPGPNLVVLDEGHLLKNGKNLRTSVLMNIKTKRRIILTGTPMQNNLAEYYYMINFVKPNLLGSFSEFSNQFINPIVNGQYDDSTEHDVRQMKFRSHVLHKKLKNAIQRFGVCELEQYLPPKYDYVVFVQLHPVQVKLYNQFVNTCLELEEIRSAKIFAHYRYLQNICCHPHILTMEKLLREKKIKEVVVETIDLDAEENYTKMNDDKKDKTYETDWWSSLCPNDYHTNINYSSKLKIMLSIVEESICCGDKVLIFSNSLAEIDCIEYFLKLVGTPSCRSWTDRVDYYRMDGTVPSDVRSSFCRSFNHSRNTKTKLFLISHRVGGLGLNLTAANRVILMDVNWNPSYDSQSIFRTYRFGQNKPCYVYRLVAMGTMEEVIYERSVTKLAISGRVVDERQIKRYFNSKDLRKMYRQKFNIEQPRPLLNVPSDVILAKVYQRHEKEFFKFVSHQQLLENIPHERLTMEEMDKAWNDFNRELESGRKLEEVKKNFEMNRKTLTDFEMRQLYFNRAHPTATLNENNENLMNLYELPGSRYQNKFRQSGAPRFCQSQVKVTTSSNNPNIMTTTSLINNNNTLNPRFGELYAGATTRVNNNSPEPVLKEFLAGLTTRGNKNTSEPRFGDYFADITTRDMTANTISSYRRNNPFKTSKEQVSINSIPIDLDQDENIEEL